jgi:hypothetical protein
MLLGYEVSGRIVRAVIIGSPTFRELGAMMEAAFADPGLARPGRLLIDASEAHLSLSEADVHEAAAVLGAFRPGPNTRCAIVVSDADDYAHALVLSAYVAWRDVEVRVFRESSSAVGWLEEEEDTGTGEPS